MKRVLCPKCENYLFFDETKYSEGQSLVFECEHCGKQFSIRLGKSKVKRLLERKKTWKKKLNLIKKSSDISLLSKMYLVLNSYFPCRKVTMS